jgi:hypothetical protein
LPVETKKLKSVLENPHIALEMVENEIQLGRIAGPFQYSPISNLMFLYWCYSKKRLQVGDFW